MKLTNLDKRMATVYVRRIKAQEITLEDVPTKIRDYVAELLG